MKFWRMNPAHLLGRRGERHAARFYRQQGFRILARAYRTSLGELDLIVRDKQFLVFVEVKTRSSSTKGQPWQAVTPSKRKQVTKAAVGYLKRYPNTTRTIRFDVVGITWPKSFWQRPQLEHFPHAFPATGPWHL